MRARSLRYADTSQEPDLVGSVGRAVVRPTPADGYGEAVVRTASGERRNTTASNANRPVLPHTT